MKRSFVIAFAAFFVMAIVAKDVAALAWDIWYVVNKEYVAKELCENKAKPAMHCNGKCHLAKQLQKLEEPARDPVRQKTPASRLPKLKETNWIAEAVSAAVINEPVVPAEKSTNGWQESMERVRSFSNFVFRPPAKSVS